MNQPYKNTLEIVVRHAIKRAMEYKDHVPYRPAKLDGFGYVRWYAGLGSGGSIPDPGDDYWWNYWVNNDGSVELTGEKIGEKEFMEGKLPVFDKTTVSPREVRQVANRIYQQLQGQTTLFA